jgi:hypothetical protein
MFRLKHDVRSVATNTEESSPIIDHGSIFDGVWSPPASKPEERNACDDSTKFRIWENMSVEKKTLLFLFQRIYNQDQFLYLKF